MNTKIEITNLLKPLIAIIKFSRDEASNILKIGLSNYLKSQFEKYYFTNNFLHRSGKVVFDKTYFPVQAKYQLLITDFSDLASVFEEYKYITILGEAGSGKSTLVKYMLLNAMKQVKRIPVLIELRHLNNNDKSIQDYIVEHILQLEIEPSDHILERELKKGKFLFLFDGFDEIYSNDRQRIDKGVNDFCDKYPNNYFLITSRPGGGTDIRERFYPFNMLKLTEKQVFEFIELQVFNFERKVELKKSIEDTRNPDYLEYLSNPLLLSMFILAFESHPEIPHRKSAFYRNVFDTLYSKHDGITKGSFPREKRSGLQREDFEKVLCLFSFISQVEGIYSYTEEYLTDKLLIVKQKYEELDYQIENLIFDLHTSISILIKEGFEYKFPHRSLQEYFSSLFVSRLSSELKKQAYSKIRSSYDTSKDNGYNLLDLCKELDEMGYVTYFYLPILKDIANSFKVDNRKKEKSFLKSFDFMSKDCFLAPRTYFEKYESFPLDIKGKRKEIILIGVVGNSLENRMVFIYENLIDQFNVVNFLVKRNFSLQQKVKRILKGENDNIEYGVNKFPIHLLTLQKILIENGFLNIIDDYNKVLIKEIKAIESIIENYNYTMTDLF